LIRKKAEEDEKEPVINRLLAAPGFHLSRIIPTDERICILEAV